MEWGIQKVPISLRTLLQIPDKFCPFLEQRIWKELPYSEKNTSLNLKSYTENNLSGMEIAANSSS